MGSVAGRGSDALKRPLRPLARPLLARLGFLQLQIHGQQEQLDQLVQQLPILLNAIATQNATAREFERTRQGLETVIARHDAEQASMGEQLATADERLTTTDHRFAAIDERL